MKAPHSTLLFCIIAAILLLPGCSREIAAPPEEAAAPDVLLAAGVGKGACHATGEVQLVWKGSAKAPTGAHADSVRFAAAVFDAHEATLDKPAKGTFRYQVLSDGGTLHREVTAAVEGVTVDPAAGKVWLVGRVVADTKGCGGGPGGGHDAGCSGDDGGGCSDGHDDGHDGGCSSGDHDEGGCTDGGTDDGGCTDGSHDDGGCTDGSHDDGGCTDGGTDDGGCPDGSHDDGGCPDGSHDDGGPGGSGGPSGATGRSCRVGQIIIAKAHDGGSPGLAADGITWKWFLADAPDLPSIDDLAAWPHLCRKTITGGNLVIHEPGNGNGPDLAESP